MAYAAVTSARDRPMRHHLLSVARDFARTPGTRYRSQGRFSGEEFRELLVSWLRRHGSVEVDLDGTAGYGSSFLEEVFGGIIRQSLLFGLTPEDIVSSIRIKSDEDPSYKLEAELAMKKALSHIAAG